MPSDVRERLERAIQEENEKDLSRLRASRDRARKAAEEFEPVRQAAEEIREQLLSVPSIKFTINPDSVWITLADRELWFGPDVHARNFIGVETAHSWFDGEPYTQRHEWDTVAACIDAMIRLCAKYVRMARAISAAAAET